MFRAKRLRWRRKARRKKQQVEDLGINASENFDNLFAKRLARLVHVRRFAGGWLLFMVLLSLVAVQQTRSLASYHLHLQPVAGGTYIEGISGVLTNANPLFASGVVDSTVSRLVFSGLLTYDEQNNLIGDLAESWRLDESGTVYTITLRENLKWHDGARLTADDVIFTFKAAQNPDVKSALFHAWKDVKVEKVNDLTVKLTLNAVFAPFEQSLTTGILPAHLLRNVDPVQLRSVGFNTDNPVGSGPFKLDTIEISGSRPEERQQNIGFVPYDSYHFGKPNISTFVIKTFVDDQALLEAYVDHRVDAIIGLAQVPEEAQKDSIVYETPTTAIQFAFFNTDKDSALSDIELRKALLQAANQQEVIDVLNYPVITADSPFLRNSFAYNPELIQENTQNISAAEKRLNKAKYTKGQDGFRLKDGKTELQLRIVGENTIENALITKIFQRDWEGIGVKTEVILQEAQDLQASIDTRNYDVLINSIGIGSGPDVYAYWHGSQADPRSVARLNFSNYASDTADSALDAGRGRIDRELRAAKYKTFLQQWLNDVPAIALYQPRFLFISRANIYNYEPQVLNTSVDRLNNVHEWMIRRDLVPIVE